MKSRSPIAVSNLDLINRVFLDARYSIDKLYANNQNIPVFHLVLNRTVEDLRLCFKEYNKRYITSKHRDHIRQDLRKITTILPECDWSFLFTGITAIDILELAYSTNQLMRP